MDKLSKKIEKSVQEVNLQITKVRNEIYEVETAKSAEINGFNNGLDNLKREMLTKMRVIDSSIINQSEDTERAMKSVNTSINDLLTFYVLQIEEHWKKGQERIIENQERINHEFSKRLEVSQANLINQLQTLSSGDMVNISLIKHQILGGKRQPFISDFAS